MSRTKPSLSRIAEYLELIVEILSAFSGESPQDSSGFFESTFSNLSLSEVVEIDIPASVKVLSRILHIDSETNVTLALAGSSNGVQGTVFVVNSSQTLRTVTLPSGHLPVGDLASPITLAIGERVELSFVQAGSDVYWTGGMVGGAFSV